MVEQPHVRVSLLSEKDSVVPGESALLGVRFRMDPGWHVYWKNPGDTGLPPKFEVQGRSSAEWLYPVPERVSISGQFVNFGYHDEVVIPARVKVDASDASGSDFRFSVHAKFLVCESQCIPAKADLELALPLGSQPRTGLSQEAPLIASAMARLPRTLPSDWEFAWEARKNAAILVLSAPVRSLPVKLGFIPEPRRWLVHSAAFMREHRELPQGREEVRLTFPVEPGTSQDLARASGLLIDGARGMAWELPARVTEGASSTESAPANEGVTLAWAVLLAFLGGTILNLMPCVFPVLWLKLFSLARQSSRSRTESLREGAAYSAGVILSFLLLAGLLIALRATGEKLGWGFQLQSPVFVAGLVLLFCLLGFQMLGVIELGSALGALGGEGLVRLTRARSETAASFWTGALAVVVATPCTAPFMGAALGYAIAQPAPVALLVFASLGLGMSIPFLAISAIPQTLARVLPRPGRWMEALKQAMAFPLFATAIWLLWVLSLQGAGGALLVPALGGVFGISGAGWLFHRFKNSGAGRRIAVGLLLVSLVASLWSVHRSGSIPGAIAVIPSSGGSAAAEGWSEWSQEAVEKALSQGRPVFVDFTAAWCVTCQVNEKLALSSASVRDLFREKRVVLLKGDWTNEDARITEELERRGRSGVPLYLLFDPRTPANPKVLPQILTEEMIAQSLRQLP